MIASRLAIVSIITAVAALILVFELLRRRRLREKYAAIWVVIAVGTVIVAAFPQILRGVADLVGIQTPSNLLFFGSLIVLFAVSLQLSREVGLLEVGGMWEVRPVDPRGRMDRAAFGPVTPFANAVFRVYWSVVRRLL